MMLEAEDKKQKGKIKRRIASFEQIHRQNTITDSRRGRR